ncbi:anti-repressor SinI family protein [Neobacillus pocheonensis]|uniref:Anti-repressor SinI family protein n=1 Tax=Neobacillus pocheonensis TaxID=363869 RepID=A0ABT0WC58_9BACI|nr:anti-repressor SinI family protein [Neobacillus pocheonensis]
MVVETEREVERMDEDWVVLILEAKELGITKESVQDFLKQKDVKERLIESR